MNSKFSMFGIPFRTSIEVPFPAIEAEEEFENCDEVEICLGELPGYLDGSKYYGNAEFVGTKAALLSFGSKGRALVTKGSKIELCRNLDQPGQFLIENFPALSAILLLQRGCFPIHGSCVEKDGQAIGFIGESGSGKSTAARAMLERGYKLVTDDILVTTIHEKTLTVQNGPSQLRLFPDPVSNLGQFAKGKRETEHSSKWVVTIDPRPNNSVKLGLLVDLNWKLSVFAEPHLKRLNLFQGLDKLKRNLYRPEFVEGMQIEVDAFKKLSEMVSFFEVYEIERQFDSGLLQKFAESIDELIDIRKQI